MASNRDIKNDVEQDKHKNKFTLLKSFIAQHSSSKKIKEQTSEKNKLNDINNNNNNYSSTKIIIQVMNNNDKKNELKNTYSILKEEKSYELDNVKIDSTFLGSGGYACVYKGKWNDKNVAIKSRQRNTIFKIENDMMRHLEELHIPNVVKYYGYYKENIVMEYMDGGSLGNLIRHYTPVNWTYRLKIMENVLRGMKYLHKHNIIHCDIKSENVLLNGKGKAKLCDFGLAKVIDNTIEKGRGTFYWQAPEILLGTSPHTKKSDVYSFAMTLWEIAAWGFPYNLAERSVVFDLVTNGKREKIPSTCSSEIAKMITRGWDQNASCRPKAKKLLNEIRSVMKLR